MSDPVVSRIVEKLYATEPDPFEPDPGRELVLELLDSYAGQMERMGDVGKPYLLLARATRVRVAEGVL